MDSSNLLKLGLEDRNVRNKSDICTLLRMLHLLIRGSLVQAHPEAQRATFERVLRVLFLGNHHPITLDTTTLKLM